MVSPRLALGVLLGLALAVPASAADRVLRLDSETTRIAFTLGATFHTVRGSAPIEGGAIRFDPESGEASGEVRVDARSLATGNARRDRVMHRKVLESETYPAIVLTVDGLEGRLEPGGVSEIVVRGRLLLHGAAHEVEIAARVTAAGERLEGSARFTVPYVEWGLADPSKFLLRVHKAVEVELRFAGRLEVAEDVAPSAER